MSTTTPYPDFFNKYENSTSTIEELYLNVFETFKMGNVLHEKKTFSQKKKQNEKMIKLIKEINSREKDRGPLFSGIQEHAYSKIVEYKMIMESHLNNQDVRDDAFNTLTRNKYRKLLKSFISLVEDKITPNYDAYYESEYEKSQLLFSYARRLCKLKYSLGTKSAPVFSNRECHEVMINRGNRFQFDSITKEDSELSLLQFILKHFYHQGALQRFKPEENHRLIFKKALQIISFYDFYIQYKNEMDENAKDFVLNQLDARDIKDMGYYKTLQLLLKTYLIKMHFVNDSMIDTWINKLEVSLETKDRNFGPDPTSPVHVPRAETTVKVKVPRPVYVSIPVPLPVPSTAPFHEDTETLQHLNESELNERYSVTIYKKPIAKTHSNTSPASHFSNLGDFVKWVTKQGDSNSISDSNIKWTTQFESDASHITKSLSTVFSDMYFYYHQINSLYSEGKWYPSQIFKHDVNNPYVCSDFETCFVQRLDIPDDYIVIAIGDIHSGFVSLAEIILQLIQDNILDKNLVLKQKHIIIFTGDMVDRGRTSLEVLYLICTLTLANKANFSDPLSQRVLLIKGNHEEVDTFKNGTFYKELKDRFGSIDDNIDVKNIFAVLNGLPSAIFLRYATDSKFIQFCHGAFTEDSQITIDLLYRNQRIMSHYKKGNKVIFMPVGGPYSYDEVLDVSPDKITLVSGKTVLDSRNIKRDITFFTLKNEDDCTDIRWGDFDSDSIATVVHIDTTTNRKTIPTKVIEKYMKKNLIRFFIKGHQDNIYLTLYPKSTYKPNDDDFTYTDLTLGYTLVNKLDKTKESWESFVLQKVANHFNALVTSTCNKAKKTVLFHTFAILKSEFSNKN